MNPKGNLYNLELINHFLAIKNPSVTPNSMFSRVKTHFILLLQGFSHALNLSLPFALTMELVSCLQILSVILLPTLLDSSVSNLSKALTGLFSYTKPFQIIDPFVSEGSAVAVMSLCGIYFCCCFGGIGYLLYRINAGKVINHGQKVMGLWVLLQSKVIFFLIHCFLVKTLDSNFSIENHIFPRNNAAWIFISIVLIICNVVLAGTRELFCFQVHQNKDTYGMKDNEHGLVILVHKIIVIMIFYLREDPNNTTILVNTLFAMINLIVLHIRIPFYNSKMLKFSIVMSTIAAWTSILSIIRVFDGKNEKLLLFVLATMGFAIKLSLIKLNWTIQNILNLKNLTPYRLAHLPSLIHKYEQKVAITVIQDRTNKETLYSTGFAIFHMNSKTNSSWENLEEFHLQIYSIIVEEMLRVHQRTCHNKDEKDLLSLCIAQIYIQIFRDSFKAMLILNKLNEKSMSIANTMSFKALSIELETLNYRSAADQDEKLKRSSASHLDYFVYKQKTQTLKELIEREMKEHKNFWKLLSSDVVEAMPAISQGTSISLLTRKINQHWKNNFENSELLYVNASIMYGLYLKIIQSAPTRGSALVRRAFSSMNNRQHPFREVIDIVLGDKAIIMASIEPDKIGKIVDVSTSVSKMFQINKMGLIGANVAMLMPAMIAAEHNNLIKRYHKHSKQKLSRVIKSYAKTMTGEFFSVDMTTQFSPYTKNGLNVIVCIEKTSECEPIMIVDPDGNIIECSKDLKHVLGLITKKSSLKVESLCKEFKEVNHAFNVIYTPMKVEERPDKEASQIQDDFILDDYLKANNNVIENNNEKETLVSPRSTRGLLLNSMENDNMMGLITSDRDKNLLFETERSHITEKVSMSKEEAEMICHKFQYGKEMNFSLSNNKKDSFKCTTEIEPLIFQGKLYKIFKFRDIETSQLRQQNISSSQVPSTLKIPVNQNAEDADEFADAFPDEIERDDHLSRAKLQRCSITPSYDLKPLQLMKGTSHTSTNPTQKLVGGIKEEQIPSSESANNSKKKTKQKTFKAQSLVTSQLSQQVAVTQLNASLKIEKQSPEIRFAINMVYLAVIIIICSIFVDLTYLKKSLEYMSNSMDLVGLVNIRLGKAILAWQYVQALYFRSVGLRKIDANFPSYKQVAVNSTMDMLANGVELLKKVDEFDDEGITEIFYEKSISFWEPETKTLFDNQKIDGFTAQQVLVDYNLYYARYPGPLTDFNQSRFPLFSLNNTGNDYLVSLEETAAKVATFFETTRNGNIRLLRMIVSLEIIFILIPCLLIVYILITTVQLYNKLFQALCKIHKNSLNWRLRQIEVLAALFEESIEDDLSYFNEYKA